MQTKEIEIQKGQKANKLSVMKALVQDLHELFEIEDSKDLGSQFNLFGKSHRSVASKSFKIKLEIVVLED